MVESNWGFPGLELLVAGLLFLGGGFLVLCVIF